MKQRRPHIPEAFVWWLWANSRAGRHLTTTDGRTVEVVYPGRRWGSWGPDFRGALLILDHAVVRGDVEVHVRAQDWVRHGHGGDPAYAATVLHVVFHDPGGADPVGLPTVALGNQLSAGVELLVSEWQAGARIELHPCLPLADAEALLARAGLARLQGKADRFEGDLAVAPPGAVLMGGLIEGLGYAANVGPLRRLLERVGLDHSAGLLRAEPLSGLASLFGQAGLLPSQRGRFPLDDYTWQVETRWRGSDRSSAPARLGWQWLGVRPANTPVRRVAGAAALLPRDWDQLAHQVLMALVELPPQRAGVTLRSLLVEEGDSYWHAHADFGRALPQGSALIGPERAADLVINVVLPWAVALARSQGNELLCTAAEAAYATQPATSTNQITRHMAQQVLGDQASLVLRSACFQQGLIQLYRGWCDIRDCATCPAG